ncbi:MAG: TIGR04076 family protein [Gemmatimonadaceae bacterium]|nr:TIGR04076 family protein [Gemmatimonadaceae bacterium]
MSPRRAAAAAPRASVRAPIDDAFTLYDLRVEVIATERPMVCNHRAGDWFELSGENLRFPPGQTFPLYPLAALLPLLPAKQRPTHPNDWMTTDAEIACPDPFCGGRFRITRIGTTTFRHGEVTAVPLPAAPPPAPRGTRRKGTRRT